MRSSCQTFSTGLSRKIDALVCGGRSAFGNATDSMLATERVRKHRAKSSRSDDGHGLEAIRTPLACRAAAWHLLSRFFSCSLDCAFVFPIAEKLFQLHCSFRCPVRCALYFGDKQRSMSRTSTSQIHPPVDPISIEVR